MTRLDKLLVQSGLYSRSDARALIRSGSVAVNGVSLTVCEPTDNTFKVCIIPFTYEHTNFHTLRVGSLVNIEFDILGKYLSRLRHFDSLA